MDDHALVLLSGGLAGAVSAGFVAKLCREDVFDQFSHVYGYSVGVYPATFGVAGQPGVIEEVWREHVCGLQLVNPFNFLTFGARPVLKLEYLEQLFHDEFELDVDSVSSSPIDLTYVLMQYPSGEVEVTSPEQDRMRELMSAASAVPIVHGPASVGDKSYLDPIHVYGEHPRLQTIIEKHDRVTLLSNFPQSREQHGWSRFMAFCQNYLFPLISTVYPDQIQKAYESERHHSNNSYRELASEAVQVIAPEEVPLRHAGDTDKQRINASFDIGEELGVDFVK